ncbi:hypothetical protein [Oceanicoccus sagamiensis]|uniref:Urease accessory protein UreH-like transmembrane domain-containing protein n=1 Tax=Oceanicoccus sagamiensis TaxID=716816 RepID=A0A1X9NH93_9GAMM|nr:hypothetical protein [Oceanicoccus sagamiensis]ARN73343.1 hypothetical protein BST96_04005 [Oceanicoccus sagamiensis]
MFSPEINVLIISAATIAFVHTLMGPDHYLPFVSMGVARKWTVKKMMAVTAFCGFGHILGSIGLGFVGVALQMQVGKLEMIESVRGDLAAWCLIAFGLLYFVWGMRRAYLNKPHTHWHRHDGKLHSHQHTHKTEHAHVHDQKVTVADDGSVSEKAAGKVGPWAIFIIFVLGPCEPLIPLLMYPAAKESTVGLVAVTGVFGAVTMLTMMFAVFVSTVGLKAIGIKARRLPSMERYGHAFAGATIFACGSSIAFLGL